MRHPIGLYAYYIFSGLIIVSLLVGLFFSVSTDQQLGGDIPQSIYIGGFSFVIFVVLLFSYVGVYVYKRNELIVTNENILQILQFGLFNQQVSQLNLAKIQDVSVDRAGILQTYFNYGTLVIETAGEASNYNFKYTPDPSRVAKVIIEAHEDFIKQYQGTTRNI